MPCSTAQRPIASTSPRGYTAPVGLLGDTNSSTFVRGVRAASSCSTVTRKPALVGREHLDGNAVGELHRFGIGGPVRRGQDDLVAGVEQRLERVVDRVLPAVGHDDLARFDHVARVAGGLRRDRGAQLGEPGRGRVLVVARVGTRSGGRVDDVRRRREVGLAGTEADDVLARGLQRLRLARRRRGWRTR